MSISRDFDVTSCASRRACATCDTLRVDREELIRVALICVVFQIASAAAINVLGSKTYRKEIGMNVLIGVLITFLVVVLVLYLINMLPIEGRAKQIVQIIVIVIGVLSLLRYLAVF